MQNITSSGNGSGPDTVLVQAQGNTGDSVESASAMAKSLADQRKAMGSEPKSGEAFVYSGKWDGVKSGAKGSAKNVGC